MRHTVVITIFLGVGVLAACTSFGPGIGLSSGSDLGSDSGSGSGSGLDSSSSAGTSDSGDHTKLDVGISSNSEYASLSSIKGVYLGAFPRLPGCSIEAEVNYIHVSEKGIVTWYDYHGDACGSGDNCYSIIDGPPHFTPGEIRETPNGLEARLNPIRRSSKWSTINFFKGNVFDGISFEYVNPFTGKLMSSFGTEHPFGTKVSSPSIEEIENNICR